MIRFFCAGCGKQIGLAEMPAGGRAMCPHCRAVVPVPGAPAAAQVAPAGPQPAPVQWDGAKLILARGYGFPMGMCAVCGGVEGVQPVEKKFRWVNPIAWLGILGGVLPLLILALVLQKKQNLPVPLCGSCRRAWTLSAVLFPIAMVLGLFAIPFVGAVIGAAVSRRDGPAIGALIGFFAWLTGLFVGRYLWVNRTQITVRRMDDVAITFSHPDPEAIQRAWGSAG